MKPEVFVKVSKIEVSAEQSLHIVLSGSSGMVGKALLPFLTAQGHRVSRLVRHKATGSNEIYWDPIRGEIERDKLEGVDAVIHLAGENILAKRWTPAQKKEILKSRTVGTKFLCEALAKLSKSPKVLVSASAIGYYGNRGDEILSEESGNGTGFLAEVCREWEKATVPAAQNGIRVVNFRIGIILTPKGGALAQMLTPFKMGLGGILANGRQWMSWIALDDLLGAILHSLTTDKVKGPVNAVAPNAVTNHEFTKVLGKVLSRPTIFPVPRLGLRALFGEMADEVLLSSTRVRPEKLLDSGYQFQHAGLEDTLRYLLGRAADGRGLPLLPWKKH